MTIKVTKQEVFLVESKNFNACISEDFYKHDPERPIVMSVDNSTNKETVFTDWYKNKDLALEDFRNFVAYQNEHNEFAECNEERTLH